MGKKILFFVCLLIFTSCGESNVNSATRLFSNIEYSINVPSSWIEMNSNEVRTDLPAKNFKVFRAGYTISGVYPKLTIFKENILTATDSLNYANANITKSPLVIKDYQLLDVKDVTIAGGKSKIQVFQAKPSLESPVLTFIQGYVIKDRYIGYTINITTSTAESNYEKYIGLITSFNFSK